MPSCHLLTLGGREQTLEWRVGLALERRHWDSGCWHLKQQLPCHATAWSQGGGSLVGHSPHYSLLPHFPLYVPAQPLQAAESGVLAQGLQHEHLLSPATGLVVTLLHKEPHPASENTSTDSCACS